MSTNILGSLPVRFLLLFLLPLLSESVSVYVANNGTDSLDCLQGSPNNPCKNLTLALEYIHDKNDSTVYIENGVYDLLPSSLTMFQSVRNITIAGEGTVEVTCHYEVNAGLSFLRSSDIHIHGICFSGCGVEHNSTSRDFNKDNVDLLAFNAALYFEACVNVTLDSVHVTESLGIAVQFYTTTGTNMIINSNFSNNPSRAGRWWSLYRVHCQPGDTSCNNDASSVDINTISNSQYIINGSVFTNNMANSSKQQRRVVIPYKTYHDAFDRGGGLSIIFKGNARNNAVFLKNCSFEENHAVYGGGLYVEMQDSSYNNRVVVSIVKFKNNEVTIDGGGMFVRYIFLPRFGVIMSCRVELEDVRFEYNTARSGNGGGLSYSSTRQENVDFSLLNLLSIRNSLWNSNTARIGAAVYLGTFHTFTLGHFSQVNFTDSMFCSNSVNQLGKSLGSGTLYINEIPVAFLGSVTFDNNYDGTALTAYHTIIQFLENSTAEFTNNAGYDGGAIALHSSSFIEIGQNTYFNFTGNHAANLGGAIYAQNSVQEAQRFTQNCFIQYYDINTAPSKWMTQVKFRDNTADNYLTNSIFSSSILPCQLGQVYGVISNSKEALDKVFCWNETIWDYGPNTCLSQIKTSAVELTAPSHINVISGKLTSMNLYGNDSQGHNVTSLLVVKAYSNSSESGVEVDPDYNYISSNNILLYKKSGVANASNSIIINTISQQNAIQTELKVKFQDCPPGLFLNESEGKCVCYKRTFGGRLKCDQSTFTAELLRGFWIDKLNNETVVAHCPNCNFDFHGGYLNLGNSLQDAQQMLCSDNSKGRLCSTCMDGYSPAINFDEFKCVECSHKHQSAGVALFFFVDICCPIVFLMVLYWIDVPLTNGLLHGPIFFAQMITTIISLDADDIIQYQDIPNFVPSVTEGSENAYTTIYDFFNLEFFMFAHNMCLPHITKYVHIIALYYIPAFVPMILVFVLWLSYKGYNRYQNCIKARCINVCCQNVFSKLPKCLKVSFLNLPQRASNVLAMFILLSYAKIAVITGYLLTPVIFYKSDNAHSHQKAVYLDGSVDYLNLDHIKGFIPAIIITVFFLIPVPLILMIFRFNDPKKNDGFFNYLLYQFQRQFRNGPEDIQSKTKELHERITGRVKNCLDHCSVEREGECCSGCCCGNGILYSYKCCKSTQLCSYTQ